MKIMSKIHLIHKLCKLHIKKSKNLPKKQKMKPIFLRIMSLASEL